MGRGRHTRQGWRNLEVAAVGHSTRSFEELVSLLESFGIRTLVDVRSFPRSRTNPQFNTDVLGPALARHGIGYQHLRALGGRRRPQPGSPNTGWRNKSFQGYADHMRTREFEEGLQALRALAARGKVAVMCAEALRWRCHRSLLADALYARGVVVQHLLREGKSEPHRLTPFAEVRGRWVSYPPERAHRVASRRKATSSAAHPEGAAALVGPLA